MDKLYKEYCKTYIGLNYENSDGFFDTVEDILFSDEVQSLKQYEQHLEIDRLQHIISVAYLAYLICKKYNLNYKEAARAAVMHDLVYYDWRNGETGRWHKLHGYRHPKLACLNANELCGSLTKLEDNIIRRHMWPLTVILPKYKESWVVVFSDKYCATLEVLYSTNRKFKSKFLKDIGK